LLLQLTNFAKRGETSISSSNKRRIILWDDTQLDDLENIAAIFMLDYCINAMCNIFDIKGALLKLPGEMG
jgi:hypothetical protein